jgi:dephospho-CoA kinase
VGAEIGRRLAGSAGMAADQVMVLDVPLLVESGREGMRGTIVVDCDPEVAIARLVEHRGFREADARARVARQASREERLAKADFTIDNGGSRGELEPQLAACWDWIQTLPRG